MYYRNGEHQKFAQILSEALKDEDKRQNEHLFKPESDRIRALNALASYYVHLSETESNEENWQKHLQNGMGLIQAADNLNFKDPNTFLTKCFYFLAQGELNNINQYLEHLKHANYYHPLSKIIKAIIEFSKGNIKESLAILKQVLRDNPRISPSVRLTIGLCYYKLGNLEKARFAFERVLELDPKNSMALVALSISELSTNINDYDMRHKAAKYLEQAFKTDENNTLALKYLADHYFLQKEFKASQRLCERGLQLLEHLRKSENTIKENPQFRKEIDYLKSDFNYILAKIQHVQENYKEAQIFYQNSVKLNNTNYAAQYGLGKIHFFYGTFAGAEQCLETIINTQKHKDCYEALRLLAQTKARQGKKPEAVFLFKRVIELNPRDHESNLEIAQLFEQTEPKNALVYYETAMKIIHSDIETRKKINGNADGSKLEDDIAPPELLINIGVLRLEVGQNKEAYEAFQQALQNCNQLIQIKPEDNRLKAIKITSKFNLGYWYEQNNRFGDASELYKQIIKDEPAYIDAYLRLAYLARTRGDMRRAFEYIEQAKKNQIKKPEEFSKPTNQFCIKGRLLHEVMEIQQSYNEYGFVLQNISKTDSYALLGQANINYETSALCRHDQQQQELSLKKAMDKYIAVLEFDEANCFAILGVGNVLAEYGKLNEAMEVYKVVKESNPNMYHPWLNQAHLSMAQSNYEGAVNLYKKCLDKYFTGGKNLEVEMYIAKSYYKMKQFDQCRKTLTNLIQRYPQVLKLKLNLGLCLWAQATEIFNKNFRMVTETEEAIANLQHAEKLFLTIMHQDQILTKYFHSNQSKESVEQEKRDFKEMFQICDKRLNYVKEMIQSSQQYLLYDKEREEALQKEEVEKSRKMQELQFMQEKEQLEKQALQREKELKEQEIAEKNLEQVAQFALDALITNKEKKGGKAVGGNQGGEGGERFINDEEDEYVNQYDSDAELAKVFEDDGENDEDFKSEDADEIKKKTKEEDALNGEGKEKKREKKHRKKEKKEKKDKKDKKEKKDKKRSKKHRTRDVEDEAGNEGENRKQDATMGGDDQQQAGGDDKDDQLVGKKRRLKRNVDRDELENEEKELEVAVAPDQAVEQTDKQE